VPPYFRSTHSLFIQAPPEKIYEALTDWALRSRWRKGIGIEWEGDSKAFLNQNVTFKVKGFPSYSFSFRVSGIEPPRRLFMEYLDKPLRGRAAIEIDPSTRPARLGRGSEEKGCEVAFHWMKVEPVGWSARFYFALGLGMWAHRIRTMETLRMLKEYLEKPQL
jgi:uncharacterized protein YndB with AHSA1/START domain